MNNCYYLMILILLFLSCENEYGNSTKYPMKQSHAHDHEHGADHDHANEKAVEIKSSLRETLAKNPSGNSIYSSENRSDWQRPHLVINHLGNLEGKTLADIGAGPAGYFSAKIASETKVKKVIALDIDQEALDFINKLAENNPTQLGGKIETRLAETQNSKLKDQEADVILISNTLTYIEDKISYLSKLKAAMPAGGRLVIVDYKMKEIPNMFPPSSERIPLYEMEQIVDNSGFKRIVTDDLTLQFQYVIVALNP